MKYIISIALFSLSVSAFASAKPYGMAGCGFGSVVVGKDGPQIIAATSNKLSTQTFSISSGTSNCVSVEDQTARIKNFIEANYESLVVDMAKGSGDNLFTLSHLYGCEPSSFSKAVQSNYDSIISSENDASLMMNNIHQAVSSSCQNAI